MRFRLTQCTSGPASTGLGILTMAVLDRTRDLGIESPSSSGRKALEIQEATPLARIVVMGPSEPLRVSCRLFGLSLGLLA